MAATRLAVFDPSDRLIGELAGLVDAANVTLHPARPDALPACAAMLIAPLAAVDVGPAQAGGPPRWIVGDGANPARVAGAAAQAGAAGVLLTPVSAAAIAAIVRAGETSPGVDLARARDLIATSLVDLQGLTGAAAEPLRLIAAGFSANDCIVWWRDGNQMTPTAARPSPPEPYRQHVASAARIAAAAAGTVITSGPDPRSVIAAALRSGPTEVAGLVAIVADAARRFSAAERTDLEAIAVRLTRELSWLSSHRRLVAEGERLLAASLNDPLTGAMTRGAFEHAIAHEAAAASRRGERLTLAVLDVVGLRRINLAHGHRAGDEVLAQIASRIRANVRANDAIGRLGGDELGILLVCARDDQAAGVVRMLIERIGQAPIRVGDGAEVGPGGQAKPASLDIRVAVRATATELAAGERSGEAAFARCYGALREVPAGEVRIVAPDTRAADDTGPDSASLSAGTVVGGTYRVVHELSRGAMGVVYRGEDLGLGRAVAIKVLRSDLASDRDLVARFRAEAAVLASLHHPNLVQVYALGEHAGEVYFVMELVEGEPLSEVLRATLDRNEWFPTAAVAQIALEIGDALDAMHARGLIHRDVKPANVLLDRVRDRAVLVDVGVAVKAGDQRDAAGTPGFAAPESFLETTDAPTTDVYGLAATVYCMLTGRPPFGSGPAPQVVQRQLHNPLVPPSQRRSTLSEAVDAVLAKALHPLPRKRWASASTFATALGRALDRPPADHAVRSVTDDPVRAAWALLEPTQLLEAPPRLAPTVPPLARGQVRAAHLRVLSRLLQHHLGEAGMARLVNEDPGLAGVLARTLAPLGWVELADLVAALARARDKIPSPLVPHKVGRGTISATFPHLFGADPASLPTETVLAALPAFWSRFHDWGDADAIVRPGAAEVVLRGYPGSTDVCAMVAAELERIVELTGAVEVAVVHTACACTGGPRCEYQLTFRAR